MTPRQCEIAAESYTACLLARSGYDVLVQYGANQPHYDLVAVKDKKMLPVSVKGSQDGGWMLAVRYVKPGTTYHAAIEKWFAHQRDDAIFFFVQFLGVAMEGVPRAYVAKAAEISKHMKTQCLGRGHGALQEDYRRDRPGSKYDHKIPLHWTFSASRLEEIT